MLIYGGWKTQDTMNVELKGFFPGNNDVNRTVEELDNNQAAAGAAFPSTLRTVEVGTDTDMKTPRSGLLKWAQTQIQYEAQVNLSCNCTGGDHSGSTWKFHVCSKLTSYLMRSDFSRLDIKADDTESEEH